MNRRNSDLELTRCESPVAKATPPGMGSTMAIAPAVSNPDATVICSAATHRVGTGVAPVAMPKTGVAPVARRARETPRAVAVQRAAGPAAPPPPVRVARRKSLGQHLSAVPRDRWLLLLVAVAVLGFAWQRTVQDVARRQAPSPAKPKAAQHASVEATSAAAAPATSPRSTIDAAAGTASGTTDPSPVATESDAARAFLAGQLQRAHALYRQLALESGSDTFASAARALERKLQRSNPEGARP